MTGIWTAGAVEGTTNVGDPGGHPGDEPVDDEAGRAEEAAESFGDLYDRCYLEMVRLATVLTGSKETAEDLVQDSFVRLHRRWPAVRQPRAYLRQSVVNACRSHHRRNRLLRRRLGAESSDEGGRGEAVRGHAGSSRPSSAVPEGTDVFAQGVPADPFERTLTSGRLSAALDGLSHRQRAALVLRFYADLSEVEIGELLGCRPGTVGSLIHRGLEALRAVVTE